MTPTRRPPARHGFTLIEIMLVVAIIVILASITILGVNKAVLSSKRQETKQTLQTAEAMWTAYDSVAKLRFDQTAVAAPQDVTVDTEVTFESNNKALGERCGYSNNRPNAVCFTRSFYGLIRTVPAAAKAMDQIPTNQKIQVTNLTAPNAATPVGSATAQIGVPAAWVKGQSFVAFDPTKNYTTSFVPATSGGSMMYGSSGSQGVYFCIRSHTSSDGTVADPNNPGATLDYNAPPNPTYWAPVTFDAHTPVLADAWGNPIIFVPTGVLGRGISGAAASGDPMTDQGMVVVDGQNVIVKSPDGRPFFASAGPDGNFYKGADNLYSFEAK